MTKTVVVLGMHRSGTSAVAGVLHKLGVNMGDKLYPPAHGNPFGHYEDIDFIETNTAILRAAGGEWHNPPSDFQIRVYGAREGQRLIDLVKDRSAKHSTWGFKDPRTCLTLPLYLPHLISPVFVIVERCCKDIAASLNKRDGISFHHQHDNETLCHEYKDRVKRALSAAKNTDIVHVKFKDLLATPEEEVVRLARVIGLRPADQQFTLAVNSIVLAAA